MAAAGRVVVIDDDEWSAEAVGDVLKDAGFDVQVTRDGKSGLRALREQPDAVAVIDLMLPDLNGWQIVDALRADERTARIPVVTCTAAIVDSPPKGTYFVRKPFTISALVHAVRNAAARLPSS
jgi:DNA-binding response OmpR family regulator